MDTIKDYLDNIVDIDHKERMCEILSWVENKFPYLIGSIKWNQPMYSDHGTFIIAFAIAKTHLSFTLEESLITIFSDKIKKSGYEHTKMLAKIKWSDEIDYGLLEEMIRYNIQDKIDCTTFFRK